MTDQQVESDLAPHPGLGPRRGKQLFVQTNLVNEQPAQTFDQILPSVSRPPPVEAVIYHRSPENGEPLSALPSSALPTSRRTSRLGFKGIFGKTKSAKGDKYDEITEGAVVEEAEEATPEQRNEPNRAMLEPVQEMPKDRSNRASKIKTTKKTPKLGSTWEPPSLFQAYPRAVKEGNLQAPAANVEAVLRLDKYRKISATDQDTSALAAEAHELGLDEDASSKDAKKNKKKRSPSLMSVECVPKLYILTTDGHLLQYAADGPHERPPERMMHLCKESAAFASDAIPGKHWVLQISQTSTEDGAVPDPKRPSMFNPFRFGADVKKAVPHLLLVMNSAEEMNTWLITIRKEIQSLGGRQYRPDEKALKSPDEAAQRLRERPSRRFLIEKDPGHASDDAAEQPARTISHRASIHSILSPPNSGLPPISVSKKSSLEKRGSSGNLIRASMALFSPASKQQVPNIVLAPQMERAASSSPRAGSFNLDKALPDRPVDDTQARIDALGIINAENLRLSQAATTSTVIKEESPLSPRSVTLSPRSPKFPVSAYNPEAAKFSTESSRPRADSAASRNGSSDKTMPNFSTPNKSKRFSHARTASASTRGTSRSGSGSAALGHTPELTDGESLPQGSVAGDFPLLIHVAPVDDAVSAPMSPGKPVIIDLQRLPNGEYVKTVEDSGASARRSSEENSESKDRSMPPPTTRQRSRSRGTSASPHPKRLSSLSYASGNLPNSDQYLLPPPHPPPTSALPALPPGVSPHTRPSSAQDNPPRRSVSPAISKPKGLRRPASMQVTSPTSHSPTQTTSLAGAMDFTLKLPIAPPMTIKERRRLSHRPIFPQGPPSAPPPSTPLPPPPSDQQLSPGPKTAQLPTPPHSNTPLQQPDAQFQSQQLPDSPPRRPSDKEGPPALAAITITKHADIQPAQNSPIQLSPISETWQRYLNRIGA